MAGEQAVGELASALMVQLCREWAQEAGQAAEAVRDLLGKEEAISPEELDVTGRIFGIVVHTLAAGDSQQLLDLMLPFYTEEAKKMAAIAEANCNCPKHRAEREAAGLV